MATKNWEPEALRALPVSFVLVAHLILLGATAALWVLTSSLNGFVEITNKDDRFLDSLGQDWSVVWESLPPLILQFFTLVRNWPADEAAFREPFAELGRTDVRRRANARATVLLDYRDKNILLRWYYALRNRHYHLGLALFLSVVFLVFITPFSAALIKEEDVVFNSTILMRTGFEFFEAALVPSHHDWTAELQLAISEDVHGAEKTRWTNGTHAFQPLSPDTAAYGTVGARLTAVSHALAVRQACVVLSESDFSVVFDDLSDPDNAAGQVTLKANDRNCYIERRFTIGAVMRPRVVEVISEAGCASQPTYRTRIVILTAEHNPQAEAQLGKLTITSCIPLYEQTAGDLTVEWSNTTQGSSPAPRIVSFQATEPTVRQEPIYAPTFEREVIDVEESGAQVFTQAVPSMFGRLVVARATQILTRDGRLTEGAEGDSAAHVIDNPDVLPEAIQVAFASVYRIAVVRLAFRATADIPPGFTEGLLQRPQTRLFARPWFAGCLVGFTLLSLASTTWLVVWRHRRPCPLMEEPKGLLSAAGLLYGAGPEVEAMVGDAAMSGGKNAPFLEMAKDNWSLDTAHFYLEPMGDRNVLRAAGLEKRGWWQLEGMELGAMGG
ncbi:hypothetical protein MFIFM68171_02313 [Madurella fahalii]|uniref:Uncharacterized protein n=1 Tax=Madurella fahalii TaxID=1157608 RepID=A0ABQ0G2W2_9PEZI